MYDTIIIGAGPAGYTAGIYAARREMKSLILGKESGGQLIWAADIENYPGFKSVTNLDLIKKMEDQVKSLGVEIKNTEVNKIEKNKDGNFIVYANKEKFDAKTVIIAIGLSPRRLAIPGEEKYSGKGVSYCANCDGPIYRNKTVAVIGGGNSAVDAAEIMSKIAKKVYLIHRSEEFKAFAAALKEVESRDNVEIIANSDSKEIYGSQFVEKLKVINSKTKKERELDVDGIFIEVGRIAHTDLVDGLADRDERKQIVVDAKCATSMEGMFAAGDVTQVPFKQITTATGEGTIAALAAYQYIQQKQGKKADIVVDRSVHAKK